MENENFIVAKNQVMYILCCKVIHASHIYFEQNKYYIKMKTNIF